ncbi:MAG TPA: type VI secretion system protein TssA [Luteibacter sp.]|nr:type VI secretion system protein TssA [Luteibacter sp.]
MDTTETLLAPLDTDAPCGPNLEYDADFLTLESLAAPKPERAVGNTVKQAEEPEWRDVALHAAQLAERTRDLRIAVHLAAAWLKTSGIPTWTDGLGLVRGLLDRYWDEVHPRLEDDDPIERINALAALASPERMLAYLRQAPLLRAERIGGFSLRDLRVLSGALKPGESDEGSPVSQEHVDLVCQQVDVDELRRVHESVVAALDHVQAIGRTFEERTPGMGPDLDALLRDLRELNTFVHAQVAIRLPDAPVATSVEDVSHDETMQESTVGTSTARGPIRGTDDVIRLLDEICAWYAVHEPSSPVPPLLRRAGQLVGLSFAELLQAIAPGGLSEFQVLSGDNGN